MPTLAGQRCSRYPSRLHRTASLLHTDSIESRTGSDSSGRQSPSVVDSAGGSQIRDMHDGTTPVIVDTPEEGQASAFSTPCPCRETRPAAQDRPPTRVDYPLPPSDVDMPDASPVTANEELGEPSGSRSMSRSLRASQGRANTSSAASSGSHLQQALRNATDRNLRARLEAYEAAETVTTGGYEALLTTLQGQGEQIDVRLHILEGQIAGGSMGKRKFQAVLALFVVMLCYACFCCLYGPELSYIRQRRQQVLGL
ncbi:hypothetical protein CERZMDRAFT_102793 [Cercospora zeae-maydis SCOH1-5]|uniref:Transmembrane protein n=1 Tax=Cercospora zeae-maydis SCOH1-5 TaxID=717836 RepID=A0A6A6F056_9PEZI|nr:hypothetical protein CERZMDRAFT_102793 [Cercospora zeae-maydis SCOH1-5]